MSGKIEPGCLALVTGANNFPKDIGYEVIVIRCAYNDECAYAGSWLVSGLPSGAIYAQEKNLLRIDDYQPEANETEQEVTV